MNQSAKQGLIICSPYDEPAEHWDYGEEDGKRLVEGRRDAGYVRWDAQGRTLIPLETVKRTRERVSEWRSENYKGASPVTQRLLTHWRDRDAKPLFFCQLEAAETLIWLTEAPQRFHAGIEIEGDGGAFARYCAKMATGTGKTVVMAMVIAWHILNKVAASQDPRFSQNVFVVAPGLTVKSRLAVLQPSAPGNYYEEFDLVPNTEMMEDLRKGKVLIRNWHALGRESDEQVAKRRGVDKRGRKSDEAHIREVLGGMAHARNILVINDEAHHAYRVPSGAAYKGEEKTSADEATVWIDGLDCLHRTRGVLACYDFSATPFAAGRQLAPEESLFNWIVSDFGLADAIESGLVKTPRVVVRDDAIPDARTFRSRLHHIYNDPQVKSDLARRAQESDPLPDLVRNAYYLLGQDWRETHRVWEAKPTDTPPVMITVCNRTETAARVKYAFDRENVNLPELAGAERMLHIDSRVLKEVEERDEPVAVGSGAAPPAPSDAESDVGASGEEGGDDDGGPDPDGGGAAPSGSGPRLTKQQSAELLRRKVDTVGKPGEPGAPVRNVISVSMLSEGWDARTVTHIMGLRPFTSQLLCEQVVGRGLRRTSYDVDEKTGLFEPEYVNVFGVPFEFLPHEDDGGVSPPTSAKTTVRVDPDKAAYEITWPNVIRVEHVLRPRLTLDLENAEPLELDAGNLLTNAGLAPVVDGKFDLSQISLIDLQRLAAEMRLQTLLFRAAAGVFDQMKATWRGNQASLIAQLIRLAERFAASDRIRVFPNAFDADPVKRKLVIRLEITKVVQHLARVVKYENAEGTELILDRERPTRSTAEMPPWSTGRPVEPSPRSHLNVCALDSAWESADALAIDAHPNVSAWVRNERVGFEIPYVHRGVVRSYRPDFLARLANGETLIIETKGRQDDGTKAKHDAMEEWAAAVTADGRYGRWRFAVADRPRAILDLLASPPLAAP